jgi:glycosyltransferase involved in cell wall biosynthesis
MRVSAYIPCYNNGAYIRRSISCLERQTRPPDELFVVDDGSEDNSVDEALAAGVRVIRMPKNLGRGAVRAMAMQNATHELVLCLDASKEVPPYFLERALPWFENPKVAAVWGTLHKEGINLAQRWMIRHMLTHISFDAVRHGVFLSTAAAVVRKASVLHVGNFNPSFRHREDLDLSNRLLAADLDIVFDPALKVNLLSPESIWTVLERDWRWQCWPGKIDLNTYVDHLNAAFTKRLAKDVAAADLPAAALTLIAPHFYLWKSHSR